MAIKLKIRKLVKSVGGWKVYANYTGETVKSVELQKGGTTYFLESAKDIDGVMERLPGSLEQFIKKLFK